MVRRLMVDLETLGTVPGCAILSIGAVEFDANFVAQAGFYTEISTASCEELFLSIDDKTKAWWEGQSAEARDLLRRCKLDNAPHLREAMALFSEFVKEHGHDVEVWGNGSDFDNAIIAVCCQVLGMPMPWKFWNNRCYRTLKNQYPEIQLVRRGVYHNALDDARSQAEHASRILAHQEMVLAVWGELQDDSLEEGEEATWDASRESGRAQVQQEGLGGIENSVRQDDAAGDRLARQNVPTGIPSSSVR